MTRFEKHNNMLFAIVFGMIAIAEFIGFLGGRNWCLAAALISALFSFMLYKITKKKKTQLHGTHNHSTTADCR